MPYLVSFAAVNGGVGTFIAIGIFTELGSVRFNLFFVNLFTFFSVSTDVCAFGSTLFTDRFQNGERLPGK